MKTRPTTLVRGAAPPTYGNSSKPKASTTSLKSDATSTGKPLKSTAPDLSSSELISGFWFLMAREKDEMLAGRAEVGDRTKGKLVPW